jgi:drug/metabolite transporter (DMT)-like permease
MIGELAALAASCCWAVGSHLFGRIGRSGEVPPGAMNLGKCLTALGLFTVTALVFGALGGHVIPAVSPRATGWLLASGFVGLALGDGAYFQAIVTIGVRRALLLLSTAPVFAAIGGALCLGEQLGLREWAGILAVMVGVGLVVYERDAGSGPGKGLAPFPPVKQSSTGPPIPRSVNASQDAVPPGIPSQFPGTSSADRAPHRLTPAGVLFGAAAGLGQAAGSLMSRTAMAEGVTALDAALVRLPAGVVGIVILAALSRRLVGYTRALRRPRVMGAVAGSAAVGTYLGIWLSQFAIGHAGKTATASTLLATSPIFALPLGKWLNADRITPRALGGTLVACAGLVLLTMGRK